MRFPRTRKFLISRGAATLAGVLRGYASSVRIHRHGMEALEQVIASGPVIFAFSHSQLLLMPFFATVSCSVSTSSYVNFCV